MLAVALSAEANANTIVYRSGLTTPLNGAVWFDFSTGSSGAVADRLLAPGTAEFELQQSTGPFIPDFGYARGGVDLVGLGPSSEVLIFNMGNAIENLPKGFRISSQFFQDGTWIFYPNGFLAADRGGGFSGQWSPGSTGFAGLTFRLPDGTRHYGWAEITVNQVPLSPNYIATLDRFA